MPAQRIRAAAVHELAPLPSGGGLGRGLFSAMVGHVHGAAINGTSLTRGLSETIGARFDFKGVEFDPFKVWVVDFFPQDQKIQGRAGLQPVFDDIFRRIRVFNSGHVCNEMKSLCSIRVNETKVF